MGVLGRMAREAVRSRVVGQPTDVAEHLADRHGRPRGRQPRGALADRVVQTEQALLHQVQRDRPAERLGDAGDAHVLPGPGRAAPRGVRPPRAQDRRVPVAVQGGDRARRAALAATSRCRPRCTAASRPEAAQAAPGAGSASTARAMQRHQRGRWRSGGARRAAASRIGAPEASTRRPLAVSTLPRCRRSPRRPTRWSSRSSPASRARSSDSPHCVWFVLNARTGHVEREAEEAARAHFERYGHWPED